MYYVNNSMHNTCAPHPNVLATTESQFSMNINISSRCFNAPLD